MQILYTLSAILITVTTHLSFAYKINDFIPYYCKPYQTTANRVQLTDRGNNSYAVIRGYLFDGLDLPKSPCWANIFAPRNIGITTTVRKIVLNDNDTIAFRSGSNPTHVWAKGDEHIYEEILTQPNSFVESNIFLNFTPGAGKSAHNAGFEIAFTAFTKKNGDCGEDFDCQNDRCIWSDLVCDGFNNCGNNEDENGCSGISTWIIVLLVIIAIVVVILAIGLWYRMSRKYRMS